MNENSILEREKSFVDRLGEKYQYDSNILHLLYVIVPAFIIKYGLEKERMIQNTLENIPILISKEKSKTTKAFYTSTLKKVDKTVQTEKFIVIQNYENIPLIELLDDLVHEMNHAIHSYRNEIHETKNYIYVRTGLTHRIYEKDTLKFVKKQDSYLLEEIINTKQTSDIINIIKKLKPKDSSLETTIYAINQETEETYESNSYFLQSYACREILKNRTFLSTLESLRWSGEVLEISKWFDDIMGEKGSYQKLIQDLNEMESLEIKYGKSRFWKKRILNQIRNLLQEMKNRMEQFNRNVNFR